MGKLLMIGAGGVATVAAFKIAQNKKVFGEEKTRFIKDEYSDDSFMG